jgi:acyl-CoA thioester hydrolase
MIKFKKYRHCIPVQIRFSDIDKLNHVNNACYHNFIEMGRVRYFEEVVGDRVNWEKSGFMLARTEIDHIEQVYLHDELYCFTRVFRIGNKSVGIKNSLVKKEKGKLIECAEINAVLVAMDYKRNASIRVPDEWRKKFSAFEGVEF